MQRNGTPIQHLQLKSEFDKQNSLSQTKLEHTVIQCVQAMIILIQGRVKKKKIHIRTKSLLKIQYRNTYTKICDSNNFFQWDVLSFTI